MPFYNIYVNEIFTVISKDFVNRGFGIFPQFREKKSDLSFETFCEKNPGLGLHGPSEVLGIP